MYAGKVGRAVDSGVKGGDDYGGPRLLGGPGDFNQLNGASVKYGLYGKYGIGDGLPDRSLLHVVTNVYHLF